MNPPAACPVCGEPGAALYCVKRGHRILACPACGCGFVDPAQRAGDPTDLYREGYHRKDAGRQDLPGYDDYFAMAPAFRRTFSLRLQDIVRLAPPPPEARLLDVGCGPGFFLELAAKRFRVTGVELGREAVDHARRRLGLEVLDKKFERGLFPDATFDVVTMFDVIEHLPEPALALRAAWAQLKPGGLLLLTTGDFSSPAARLSGSYWHLLTPPEHLFYFSRRGLAKLLEAQGFAIERVSYPSGHFSIDYLAERLVKSFGVAAFYRKSAALRRRLQERIVPVNLWDIMMVAARKRA